MAQFVKTSQGFINLDRVEIIDQKSDISDIRVWLIGAEGPFKFSGKEAQVLRMWLNNACVFDAIEATTAPIDECSAAPEIRGY